MRTLFMYNAGMQKRVLTFQDYSCFGRCSLTVALPTLSACGVETVGVPTSLLSNHTQFPEWSFLDLKDELPNIFAKWDALHLHFDAILTGYLSTIQIPVIKEAIRKFGAPGTTVIVDPAMADHGELYPGFGEEHVAAMRELVAMANIVKPNVTEALLLAGRDPSHPEGFTREELKELAEDVAKLGPKTVLITGIEKPGKKIANFLYDNGACFDLIGKKRPGVYHGTGDLFSAAFTGALVNGCDMTEAVSVAHKFVVAAIEETLKDGIDGKRFGPQFEKAIPTLIKLIKKRAN